MARNIDRSRFMGQQRMPQADTFRALSVPHVGAQRRESQGDNYRRLAASLGRFGAGLDQFARGMSALEQAKSKSDLLTSLVNDPTISTRAKAGAHVDTGLNPVLDAVKTASDFKAYGMPAMVEQFEAGIKQAQADGWVIKDTDADDEVGQVDIPITTSQVKAKFDAIEQKMDEKFPRNSPENIKIRNMAAELLLRQQAAELDHLEKYRAKERNNKFETVVTRETPEVVLGLSNAGKNPDEIVKAVTDYTDKLAKDGVADISTPKSRYVAASGGLEIALEQANLDNLTDTDIQLARGAAKFVQGHIGTTGMTGLTHQEYEKQSKRILAYSQDILAKAAHDRKRAAAKLELAKAMQGRRFNATELDIGAETKGGTKTFKFTKDELIEELATERDTMAVSTSDGLPLEVPENVKMARLVAAQRGTGVESPRLKEIFKNFSIPSDVGTEEPMKFDRQMDAFVALRRQDPMALDNYVTDADDRKAMEVITLLHEYNGMSLRVAGQMYLERAEDVKAQKASTSTKDIINTVNKWKRKTDDIGPADKDRIIEAFDYIHANTPGLTPEKAQDALEKLHTMYGVRRPAIAGAYTETPDGEPAAVFATKLENFVKSRGFQDLGVKPGQFRLELSRSKGVYYMTDNAGNPMFYTEGKNKGEPIRITVARINAYDDWLREGQSKNAADAQRDRFKAAEKLTGQKTSTKKSKAEIEAEQSSKEIQSLEAEREALDKLMLAP